MEDSMEVPQKLKTEQTHDPAIILLRIYSKQMKMLINMPLYSLSHVYNSQHIGST